MKSINKPRRCLTISVLTALSLIAIVPGSFLLSSAASAAGKIGKNRNGGLHHNKIAFDLSEQLHQKNAGSLVNVILQLNSSPSGQLNALLRSNGVRVKGKFSSFNSYALSLPVSVVNSLATFPEVEFVSIDSEVKTLGGHIAHTSGTDNVRSMSSDGALDGNGIGIGSSSATSP